MENTPSLRTKLIFWLLLSFLSVAIAEVTVASAPFAFVNPAETAFLTVFYGSHLLVIAWLAFRRGWPSFQALWLGGVLFGLYEFYITKVMWAPPWGGWISLAHIDVVALILLAFCWHPFMAFIFPLAVGEAVGTSTRSVAGQLPSWLTGASRRSIYLAFTIAAILHGLVSGNPMVALVSTGSALGAVLIVSWWWRRAGRHTKWDLRDLLPTDRQGKGIALLLAAQYLILTPLWNVDNLPPLLGHIVVWLLYAGFALLFRDALADEPVPSTAADPDRGWPASRIIAWTATLLVLAMLGSLGSPDLGAAVIVCGGVVVGVRTLIGAMRTAGRAPTEAPLAGRDGDQAHTS